MKERNAAINVMRKEDPWSTASWGVPRNKGGKAGAIPLWRAAHNQADKFLDYMKKTGQAPSDMDVKVIDRPNIIPHTNMVVPDSEEEMAVLALRELFLLAIGPTAIPEKIKAANSVLAYTKTKPESVSKLRVEKAEDFLDLIAEVNAPNDDPEAD